MIRVKLLIRSLLLPLAVGLLGSLVTGMKETRALYAVLPKPPFAPPGIVFPIVWTALYLLMGLSAYLVRVKAPQETVYFRLYYFLLLLNFLWMPLFFKLCWFGWALIDIGVMAAVLLVMMLAVRRVSLAAMLMQIPHLLWLLYAGYLNYGIMALT